MTNFELEQSKDVMFLLNPDTVFPIILYAFLERFVYVGTRNDNSLLFLSSESKPWFGVWHAVCVNVHPNSHKFCIGYRGLQVFPWWILPQWGQFIKKLIKMGFDSCSWEKHKRGLLFYGRTLWLS